MTMEVREIDDIKDQLRLEQMARHPYLRDYSDYSVLTTVNEAMGVQVQFIEEMAKAAIEANSVWTASGDDLEMLCTDRGITRQDGTRSNGTLTFRTSTPATNTIVIETGTVASAIGVDGSRIYVETIEDGVIDVGQTSVTVDAQSQNTGTDGNVPEYAVDRLIDHISGVRVENTAAFTGGTDEESDDDLRDRYKYATDINGRATLPLMEQHIYDLETVRECQIYTKAAGEIEIVVDTEVIDEDDDDVVDCIEENMAVGIVARGKLLASIVSGAITPISDTIEAGKLLLRVESNIVSPNESLDIYYTNTVSATKVAHFVIPSGSVKGDVIVPTVTPSDDLAVEVVGGLYTGSKDYSVLGGFGTYPNLYILPKLVLVNVQIAIIQTETPDPELKTKIEDSIRQYLDEFFIGDDIEFSDLIPYVYMDYETRETTKIKFEGIDQVTSIAVTAKGYYITGFGQTITIDTDERVEPGAITVTLT